MLVFYGVLYFLPISCTCKPNRNWKFEINWTNSGRMQGLDQDLAYQVCLSHLVSSKSTPGNTPNKRAKYICSTTGFFPVGSQPWHRRMPWTKWCTKMAGDPRSNHWKQGRMTLHDGWRENPREFYWGPVNHVWDGDESRHITIFGVEVLGLLSGERLPFSSVLGVKYAVVMAENAVKQCPSPSTVKMDHKSPAAKSLSYPLDSSCVCVFVLFWGYSQNRWKEQKIETGNLYQWRLKLLAFHPFPAKCPFSPIHIWRQHINIY